MSMFRIYCPSCGWTTNAHYNDIDCIKEKEEDHFFGLKEGSYDAHDSAFGYTCPKCGKTVQAEQRYFSNDEIRTIQKKREENG